MDQSGLALGWGGGEWNNSKDKHKQIPIVEYQIERKGGVRLVGMSNAMRSLAAMMTAVDRGSQIYKGEQAGEGVSWVFVAPEASCL